MNFNESWLEQEIILQDELDLYCKLEGVDRFTLSENQGESESGPKKSYWSAFQSIFHGDH